MTFSFYYDAGHGWLKVKIADLIDLDIYNRITQFSYVHDDTVYLEEDCDAGTFLEAYESRYDMKPKIKEIDHGNNSKIRRYRSFCVKEKPDIS